MISSECRTQMHLARAGVISAEMGRVAEREHLPARVVREEVALGRMIIPANPAHVALDPMAIGLNASVKVNANIGSSPTTSSREAEVEKLELAQRWGADTVMDLSTGRDIDETRAGASREVDYEVELAVVIGRAARRVPVDEALSYVGGYTVMNDISARDLQFETSQWLAGKALDTFAPTGPVLVPADAVPDPQALRLSTRVNGETLQDSSTASMVFGVAELVSYISGLMTLDTGDIIATGTPAGVGFTRRPPRFLRAGDVVEVSIDSIGTLRNHVVDESASVAH